MSDHSEPHDTDEHADQAWADLLSPGRREMIVRTGLTAAALVTAGVSRVARAAPARRR